MGFHYIALRTYVHATEDPDRVKEAMRQVAGDAEIEESGTTGYHGNPITILEARIDRDREIRSFFERLGREQIAVLLSALEDRMDEEGVLYFRLDKQRALEGIFHLVTHDDVISIRGKAKAYPKTRERALANAREYLSPFTDPMSD